VVIAIIGLLASISVIALNTARAKARDTKRVADIKQISTALELFFNDMGRYPSDAEWASGSIYSTSSGATTTYLANIPTAPTTPDGSCTAASNAYQYTQADAGANYYLNFCLGGQVSSLPAGKTCGHSGGTSAGDCCQALLAPTVDGHTYDVVQIGTQCWMAENLNVGVRINGTAGQANNGIVEKYCFDDLDANCTARGGLYIWNEAMQYSTTAGAQGICPDNWHIPTNDEWTTLERAVCTSATCVTDFPYGDTQPTAIRGTDEGAKLKLGGSSGFNSLFPGMWYFIASYFSYQNTQAYYWTSSLQYGSFPYDRNIGSSDSTIRIEPSYSGFGQSVRCLHD